jgi:CubicO group peptidase (beta-lactamase class C family)
MVLIRRALTCLSLLVAPGTDLARAQSRDSVLARQLEALRVVNNVPALGAAFVEGNGTVTFAVAGVRKRGSDVRATVNDQWHLGSDTKAMTATILAVFVERGSLKWETTLGEVFPDLRAKFRPEFAAITITQLLSHHAGLARNVGYTSIAGLTPRLMDQRLEAVRRAASEPLTAPAGTKMEYSNLGYVIAGAVAERIAGKPWESLMREMLFEPLGMKGCGFGGLGTPGQIDQPWPHGDDGKPASNNGPTVDNLAVIGPAGTVHCPLTDWAKFVLDQLRGETGKGKLLRAATYKALHEPRFGGPYALGWGVSQRPWAGGVVYLHSGSNTLNYSVVWIAPLKDFAILTVTNQGGPAAQKATDDAAEAVLRMKGFVQ